MATDERTSCFDPKTGRRYCEDCNDYSDHRPHGGLVFRFFNDEAGKYHRHIVYCSDYAKSDPVAVALSERIQ